MYFKNVTTIDEAKNLFKSLCLKLHPDTSGYDSQSDFIKMYNEFKSFKPSNNDNNESFNADEFYDLLQNFNVLFDIKVSFVGSFIWLEDEVKGATYTQRVQIKSMLLNGYNTAKFAPSKKLWYYSPIDYVRGKKGIENIEEIKKKYGNKTFATKGNKQIA